MTPVERQDAIAAALGRVNLFEGLERPVLDALVARAHLRNCPAGTTIFVEGEAADGLYIVDEGWVRVFRTSPQGREQVLQFVGPGEAFNPIGAFSSRPSPATAVALEHSQVVVIPRDSIRAMLQERPDFAMRLLENMSDRLTYLVGLVADLSLRPVTGRLARLLLDSAGDGVLRRQSWLTLAELASRLGTVPDVIQRVVTRLQADGVLDVTRREIRILDRERLEELAE